MIKKVLLVFFILGLGSVFAHEGHDDAPGAMKSNHGGVVKSGKEFNLEYVVSGTEVKLFAIGHNGQELPASDMKLKVSAKLPKGKPQTILSEIKNGTHLVTVDFKNNYRVEMNVEVEANGKKSSFKFQVEK